MIGVFDSGLGGLSILHPLKVALPHHGFVYFADTARLPYGNKSQATVIDYSIENTLFLLEQGAEVVVVACNTASALALSALKEQFSIPILDVISPTVDAAVRATMSGRIGVIGTEQTIASKAYEKQITALMPRAQITSIASPLLVPMIEERMIDESVLDRYLTPLKAAKIDTLVLGCTHYPLIKDQLQAYLGDDVRLCDATSGLTNKVIGLGVRANRCETAYFVSGDPVEFADRGSAIMNASVLPRTATASHSPAGC